MKIDVIRNDSTATATIGSMLVDDVFQCFTLEDVVREIPGAPVGAWKIYGETAIPRGTYRVDITYSPHFGRDLPLLVGVPGFDGVRIHPGNSAADTEGCILVGNNRYTDTIGNSRVAFDALFLKIEQAHERGEAVMLEVR